MQVKLISITQPLVKTEDESRYLTPEELIVYCARVSNPNNQLNVETSDKLLNYCIRNKHWSIFEQVDLTVEIKTSVAIAAQILRHKSASFQQFSARYAQVQEFERIELRKQGKTNRQVGEEEFNPTMDSIYGDSYLASEYINHHIDRCKDLYNNLIEAGVAKECARMVLPTCSSTTLYMKNNIRNLLAYLNVRLHKTCQKEHRLIAEGIRDIFIKEFPMTSIAFNNFENAYEEHFI